MSTGLQLSICMVSFRTQETYFGGFGYFVAIFSVGLLKYQYRYQNGHTIQKFYVRHHSSITERDSNKRINASCRELKSSGHVWSRFSRKSKMATGSDVKHEKVQIFAVFSHFTNHGATYHFRTL